VAAEAARAGDAATARAPERRATRAATLAGSLRSRRALLGAPGLGPWPRRPHGPLRPQRARLLAARLRLAVRTHGPGRLERSVAVRTGLAQPRRADRADEEVRLGFRTADGALAAHQPLLDRPDLELALA